MCSLSPYPAGLTIEEVRSVIVQSKHRPSFREFSFGGVTVFDALTSWHGAFPSLPDNGPGRREAQILRECRGLVFSSEGELLGRRYPKFFNVGERPETDLTAVDWRCLESADEKLDGSMMSPVILGGHLRLLSRRGLSDVASVAERAMLGGHVALAREALAQDISPIFEFLSPAMRIVLRYEAEALVLTGMRRHHDGGFLSRNDLEAAGRQFRVPVGPRASFNGDDPLLSLRGVRDNHSGEGVVLRLTDGTLLKIKTKRYAGLHDATWLLTKEQEIWRAFAEDRVDDASSLLDANDREEVQAYCREIEASIARRMAEWEAIVSAGMETAGGNLRAFADAVARDRPVSPEMAPFLLATAKRKDVMGMIRHEMKRRLARADRRDAFRRHFAWPAWTPLVRLISGE